MWGHNLTQLQTNLVTAVEDPNVINPVTREIRRLNKQLGAKTSELETQPFKEFINLSLTWN